MNRAPFDPRTVLGLVLFGAATFIAMLWFIGQGDTGPGADRGQAHAAANGLTGYSALAALLEAQGHEVSLSRSKGRLEEEALLVLTPTMNTDADDLQRAIDRRRLTGPTLVILPKWYARPLPRRVTDARKRWVAVAGSEVPRFARELDGELKMDVSVQTRAGARRWSGIGLSGTLPRNDRGASMGLDNGPWASLVRDADGRDLAAFADDQGCYPVLEAATGLARSGAADCNADKWTVVVVFEPDLVNNWGLADRGRAIVAARLVDLAREGEDLPVVFDLTFAGLGGSANLLTLAFTPPFLAATLCLLIALAIVGWRGFARFGPPVREGRAIAFGKARLARSAGSFVRRSGRLHLLAAPYAALTGRRIAAALGLRGADTAEIDRTLARRTPGGPAFGELADRLLSAQGPGALLRAASALHQLERTVRR